MSPLEFQIFFCAFTILGFVIGIVLSPIQGTWFRVISGIICALVIGIAGGITLDVALMSESATTTEISLEVVDTFAGTNLFGNDLTLKLSNGEVLHFEDPYKWKQFPVGSQYNCTKYTTTSMISGNNTRYDYMYIGVI